MKKSVIALAFAIAALPIIGFATPALADSPGQLANGPEFYQAKNVTQNGAYASSIAATCNDTVRYNVTLANSEFGLLSNVTVRSNIADGSATASAVNAANATTSASGRVAVSVANGALVYVPGTTVRISSDGSTRTPVADGITSGGVNVGNLNGSTVAFVQFEAKVECAPIPTPTPTITPNAPVYKCESLTISSIGELKISATVKYTASNGATFNNVSFAWGDNTANTVTTNTTAEHTFAKDGTYTVRATPSFTVDGQTVTADSASCAKNVTFEKGQPVTPPSNIPSTGAGETIGLFAGATLLSAAGFRAWQSRRLGN